MKGSIFLTSFAGMYCAGSKFRTSPAIRVGKVLASKCVTGPMPLLPARMLPHAVATSLPTGDTSPSPVTTTRRFESGLFIRVFAWLKNESCAEGRSFLCNRSKRPGKPPRMRASGLDVRLDVIHRLLHGGDLLGLLVRDLGLELLLEGHDQLHGIERIGAQIVHERGIRGDVFFLDAKLLDDDLLDALFDAAHVG